MPTPKKLPRKFAIIEARKHYYNSSLDYASCATRTAGEGLKTLGYEIVLVTEDNLTAELVKGATAAKGTARFARKVLHLQDRPQPVNVDVPASLRKHAGRRIWKTTLGEIRRLPEKSKVFIKSLHVQKAFSGHVFGVGYAEELYRLTDDYPILAQSVVDIQDENRFYVLKGEVLSGNCGGIRKSVVQRIVDDYVKPPVAYAIDVGVIRKGRAKKPVIVETNEMFSCGFAGNSSQIDFARALEARWHELLGI